MRQFAHMLLWRTPFQLALRKNFACREARHWAGSKTPTEVWQTCRRGDWMLWLLAAAKVKPERVVAALEFAEVLAGASGPDTIARMLHDKPDAERAAILARVADRIRELVSVQEIAAGLGIDP